MQKESVAASKGMYRINIRLLYRCTQESGGVIMSSFHLPNGGVVKSDGHRQRGFPVLHSMVHCGGRSLWLTVLLCLTSISWVPLSVMELAHNRLPDTLVRLSNRSPAASHLLNLLVSAASHCCPSIPLHRGWCRRQETHRILTGLWKTLKESATSGSRGKSGGQTRYPPGCNDLFLISDKVKMNVFRISFL